MKKQTYLLWFAGCLALSATKSVAQNTTQHPNVVYILADDLGYGDIKKLNPDAQVVTPNLDRLVTEGASFTNAHSGSAVCTPTRYGILTGRYAFRSSLKKGVLNGFACFDRGYAFHHCRSGQTSRLYHGSYR